VPTPWVRVTSVPDLSSETRLCGNHTAGVSSISSSSARRTNAVHATCARCSSKQHGSLLVPVHDGGTAPAASPKQHEIQRLFSVADHGRYATALRGQRRNSTGGVSMVLRCSVCTQGCRTLTMPRSPHAGCRNHRRCGRWKRPDSPGLSGKITTH